MPETRCYRGLTDAEVAESRARHGANLFTPPAGVSLFRRFLDKFTDPLIVILLVAGVLSVGISFYEYFGFDKGREVFFEPVGIFVAIILATGLAFLFEVKADKEFAVLNRVNDDEPVFVIRDGNTVSVTRKDVVVGDIVILSTGDEVPADGKLLEAVSLMVDESSLTGEPVCGKTTKEELFDPDATFPSDCVMRGTKVMEGHGVMVVTAVGDATENGKVYEAARIDSSVKTPLNIQLERLGRLISTVSYAIAMLVVLARLTMYFISEGDAAFDFMAFVAYFLQTVMIAVTLIVVAVPEGLPMAVTLSLAYSMRRMLKTNNLVRRMHACETMGATTVICTDKTGTLTENQMRVYSADFSVEPAEAGCVTPLVAEALGVNSTARLDLSSTDHPLALGNPTEGALLLWLWSNGVDYRKIRETVEVIDEVPFTTERKYMATEVRSQVLPDKSVLYVKGAPEIVRGMCTPMDSVNETAVDRALAGYQQKAMRTLGFAYKIIENDHDVSPDGVLTERDLTFMGVVAISDPVRAEVPDAVRECLEAGIAIKIVTGDTPDTAREIARQIGLWSDSDDERSIIIGPDFAALTDDELLERVDSLKVIARARPLDKRRLVEVLQRKGEVVAVTGDGTNDAPALKAAQVGLAMGNGTSVAKEAGDITIIDNSFASIGRAVMWGRSLYRNIQRFVLFQMTVNVVACVIVLFGAFMGTDSPLTVTQMLWVNLIMDTFAAMALASLPPSASVMREKPRDRKAFIITPAMARNISVVGGIFSILLLALLYVLHHTDITRLSQLAGITLAPVGHVLSAYELSIFFTMFVFLQFWNMFNARAFATSRSAFHLSGCSEFLMIAAIILFGQVLIVELGGSMFNVVPLRVSDWVMIICSTSFVLWIGEAIRARAQSWLIEKERHN